MLVRSYRAIIRSSNFTAELNPHVLCALARIGRVARIAINGEDWRVTRFRQRWLAGERRPLWRALSSTDFSCGTERAERSGRSLRAEHAVLSACILETTDLDRNPCRR